MPPPRYDEQGAEVLLFFAIVPTPPTRREAPSWPWHSRPYQIRTMASRHDRVKMRRPWTTATAVLTAAHHGFELSSGVGLVLQPELGLGFAGALWGTVIPAWVRLATKRDDTRWDPLLAAWSGASLRRRDFHPQVFPLTTRCSIPGPQPPSFRSCAKFVLEPGVGPGPGSPLGRCCGGRPNTISRG